MLDVYLFVSESGYRIVPVTLSIDNSVRHPYLCPEILWPTVMLKNITKVESIVELGHETIDSLSMMKQSGEEIEIFDISQCARHGIDQAATGCMWLV